VINRLETTVAAGATNENIVSGRSIEFTPDDARLTILSACTAAGLRMSVRLTDEVVVDGAAIPNLTSGQPIFPDHLLLQNQAMARGDHLIISITNTTAAPLVAVTLIDVSPL